MEEREADRPNRDEGDDTTVEQHQAGERADPGEDAERPAERREQDEEGLLRDSDQGVGGQFE